MTTNWRIWLGGMLGLLTVMRGFAAGHTTDTLDAVKKAVEEQKAVLVDVRETDEWTGGHVKNATLVPLTKLQDGVPADELAKTLPKDKVIYLHCASGGRCLVAAEILRKQGYDVRPLKPGYRDLVKAGFPSEK